MGFAGHRKGELWVLMQARRLGFGRSPLRRRVDRLESAIVWGAVLAALLMIPTAAAIGTAVRNASERSAADQQAVLTQVRAQTLENSEPVTADVPASYTSLVKVGWTNQAGQSQEGRASVPAGTKQGTELTVWLDSSGAITTSPRRPGDSKAIGGAVGLSVAMLSWLVLAGLARLAAVPLNRRRYDDWAREWELVAPRWRHPQN
ncbi:hypothetical protein EV646_106375 [Kribbella antiqua]|uniref:Uncharacterized protein n=1 Tax=Kribbella antiqua TaxID=2512217 RepID=A0A4R2IWB6_9ACTN|nr:hypothetical protein [Kribbella antiqua]TCO47135.1 hypothetical protein EV646_106375 [Kribbella antiqua]